jgi:hypothetical protein
MAYGTVPYGLKTYGAEEERLLTVGRQSMELVIQPAFQESSLPIQNLEPR